MKDWELNFVEVCDGQITIKNHTTSNIIEIISDHPENIKPTSIFLEWAEFESLIRCIDRITK
jgi:hypothetical protein